MDKISLLITGANQQLAEQISSHFKPMYPLLYVPNVDDIQDHDLQSAMRIVLFVFTPKIEDWDQYSKLRSRCHGSYRLVVAADNESVIANFKSLFASSDSYIIPPIINNLQQKIEALTGKQQPLDSRLLRFNDIFIDVVDCKLISPKGKQKLGMIEYKILATLINNKNGITERQELMSSIWDETSINERALDPHINSIRKKLSSSNSEIITYYGKGFKLVAKQN